MPVPELAGKTRPEAETAIAAAGLVVGTISEANSDTVPSGQIVSQVPAAGTQAAPGSAVDWVVSLGPTGNNPVTVPELAGKTQSEAASALTAAGLALGSVSESNSDTVPARQIISQVPAAGAEAPAGSAVDVVVSLGPNAIDPVTVPDLAAMTQAQAVTALQTVGLALGTVGQANSATVPAGQIISQVPAAASQALPGSAVNVVISLGPATSGGDVPPDPATLAPPIDPTTTTTTYTATRFLYSGDHPIQTGVAADAIEFQRAAVIRGRVLDKQNNPLAGVTVNLMGHPELGQTLSRQDGGFDLAVNGGGVLTVNYRKTGYLPAQRQVNAPWQDYVFAEDALLIQQDAKVNAIDLNDAGPAFQVAQGTAVTDQDGTRRATLLIPKGTQAQIYRQDGTTTPVSSLHLRLTEYTVGANGPQSMPGPLPPTSAYTYAFEMKADEADIKIAGKDVLFDRPVPFYIDNFLGFPVGMTVPVGYYDKDKAVWVPSENGRVIRILAIAGGSATIDSDGDGQADDAATLSALSITDGERAELATRYAAGQSFWRVQVSHLSTWDCNWPARAPDDAEAPKTPERPEQTSDKSCKAKGSIVECENQVLRESLGITGTGLSLNYASDRVPGRKAAYTLDIPLSGAELPASVQRIDLVVEVAGQRYEQSFPRQTNLSHTFTWDGRDGYGRPVPGIQTATVRIAYAYEAQYATPAEMAAAFGRFSGIPLEGSRARNEIRIWQERTVAIGLPDIRAQDVAGWSLSSHHRYDPVGRILHLGDGGRRSANALASGFIISTFAGSGAKGFGGDGGPATAARFNEAGSVAAAPDGSLYIADGYNNRIRRVGPDGTITTIAGTGYSGYTGDGGPATQARLGGPHSLAMAPDGGLYVATGLRVRLIRPDGIITTVAGNGDWGYSGDGGPALQASLRGLTFLAAGADGSLYISDRDNGRVRRVGPDGITTTIAGTGTQGYSGDGGPADQAKLNNPWGLAAATDGSLYIADKNNHRIRRVGPDGITTTVAGTGTAGFSGDGGPAAQARLSNPESLAVASDGSLYIQDSSNVRIRRVGTDGIISTVVGSGVEGFRGDGGPATQARIDPNSTVAEAGLALGADGSIYLADHGNHRIRKLERYLPGASPGDYLLPSEDGGVVYRFDFNGRHLATLNALTGAALLSFTYDPAGNLTKITDGDGLVTTIERDATGKPTAIVAPFGQHTELTLDAAGHLAKVANPAGETYEMAYSDDGLLSSFQDPRGNASSFGYDSLGLLLKDSNAASGSLALSRNALVDGHAVAVTTALARVTTHSLRNLATGERERSHTQPDGTVFSSLEKTDGTVVATEVDGSVATTLQGPDPRFAMLAPIAATSSVATGGLTLQASHARTATLSDPLDPLSLTALTDTSTVNGRASTVSFDKATRTFTATSAAGRQSRRVIDDLGRTLESAAGDILPVFKTYDPQGRLATITQGSGDSQRQTSFAYGDAGYLASVTDALGRKVAYGYDLAGRVISQTLPDGRDIRFGYDAKGNLTSLTPPGRPAHGFTHDAVDQVASYAPPPVTGSGDNATAYTYDLDKALTRITRPDALTLEFGHDSAGRLSKLTTPDGETAYSYDATTGKLTGIAAAGGESLAYTYAGTLLTRTAWSGTVAGSVDYGYDNDFRIASVSVNNADAFVYRYDGDSLLTSVKNEALGAELILARDAANGLLTGTSLGGVTDSYSYDGFAELTGYLAQHGTSELFQTGFTRDKLGRITRKVETVDGASHSYDYGYDLAGRLIEVKRDGTVQETYGYDTNGNRTHLNGSPIAHYDDQDRMLDYGGATYTYTANGELASKTLPSGGGGEGQVTSYRYDVLGNLREVTLPDGTRIDYVIDGQNRRIGKKRNGVLEQGFLYQSQLKPVAELDGSGNLVSRFVYAIGVNVPDFLIKGGVTYRLIKDHLGSPRLVVDVATGTVAQRMDYDAWGNITLDTHPGFQPFGFAGGIYDRDTGLVRFGARDYDSMAARWSAKDPYFLEVLPENLFGYVYSDPINSFDTTGQVLESAGKVARVAEGFQEFGESLSRRRQQRDEEREKKIQEFMTRNDVDRGTAEVFVINPGESLLGGIEDIFGAACDAAKEVINPF